MRAPLRGRCATRCRPGNSSGAHPSEERREFPVADITLAHNSLNERLYRSHLLSPLQWLPFVRILNLLIYYRHAHCRRKFRVENFYNGSYEHTICTWISWKYQNEYRKSISLIFIKLNTFTKRYKDNLSKESVRIIKIRHLYTKIGSVEIDNNTYYYIVMYLICTHYQEKCIHPLKIINYSITKNITGFFLYVILASAAGYLSYYSKDNQLLS